MNLYCPKCGAPVTDSQARFCSRCGHNFAEKVEVDPDTLPETRVDLREGMTKGNKGFHKYTKWGRRQKKPIDWEMEK